MNLVLRTWHLVTIFLASWINRQQQEVIEYLRTENAVLKERIGKKRILLNDDQRRRLAVKGKILGRKALDKIGSLFTPDTILRWHRQLVARKWDYSDRKEKKQGRPRIRQVIVDLTLKIAKENPTWGYDRIQGELSKVGYQICDSTVANILTAHGIEPAPNRKRTGSWATFLKSHWDVMAAIDFTSVRSLDQKWPRHFLSALCHGVKNSPSAFRRIHDKSPRNLGETDGSRIDQP